MNIGYVVPGLGPCGGMRVVVEHVNRLADRGHTVCVITSNQRIPDDWIALNVPAKTPGELGDTELDAVVATGFATVAPSVRINAKRHYWFMQMFEQHFSRKDQPDYERAYDAHAFAARHKLHVITIADWLVRGLHDTWGIEADHVPNAVNEQHFYPVRTSARVNPYVMIEGDDRNPAKDTEGIGWRVAKRLRAHLGIQLRGYAGHMHRYSGLYDEFVVNPSTEQMRHLYSGALFLLKASHYEGRALAPLEAMACATTTARAIVHGDDDLVHNENCLRVGYDEDALYEIASELVMNTPLRLGLSANAYQYAKRHLCWDPIISQLESLYSK